MERLGEAAFEYKLDGARVQVHRRGDDVRAFSRGLNDVTGSTPELVAAVAALPAREIILDGEAIALRPDGRPQPFQVTMRRFGRKLDVAAASAALPLRGWFFDCLYLDGDGLIERPTRERLEALDHVVHVRPELVVEIAVGDVQKSPRYPGGLALRFARVKRYRPDKRPAEADTIDQLRALLPGAAAPT